MVLKLRRLKGRGVEAAQIKGRNFRAAQIQEGIDLRPRGLKAAQI